MSNEQTMTLCVDGWKYICVIFHNTHTDTEINRMLIAQVRIIEDTKWNNNLFVNDIYQQ